MCNEQRERKCMTINHKMLKLVIFYIKYIINKVILLETIALGKCHIWYDIGMNTY